MIPSTRGVLHLPLRRSAHPRIPARKLRTRKPPWTSSTLHPPFPRTRTCPPIHLHPCLPGSSLREWSPRSPASTLVQSACSRWTKKPHRTTRSCSSFSAAMEVTQVGSESASRRLIPGESLGDNDGRASFVGCRGTAWPRSSPRTSSPGSRQSGQPGSRMTLWQRPNERIRPRSSPPRIVVVIVRRRPVDRLPADSPFSTRRTLGCRLSVAITDPLANEPARQWRGPAVLPVSVVRASLPVLLVRN